MIGKNTSSGEALTAFVERVENLRAQKKQVGQDEAAVIAEAKAAGFVPSALREVIKRRAMKPHQLQEASTLIDTYMHALGMAAETPLFRQVGLMSVDTSSREAVIEALKKFVPDNGSILVEAGGRPIRLTRDKDGHVTAAEQADPPPPARNASPASGGFAAVKPPPPDVDAEGAEGLGREAFKANAPIISNPFPFGDARRARWDGGWRAESGTDGMGPDDE